MNKPETNEYRSSPRNLGPAHDGSAVKRYNLRDDAVSVVHSGESDPAPNQEAQEAYSSEERTELSDENDFEEQQMLAENPGEKKEDVA